MVEHELLHLTISGYLLGSNFCHKPYRGEICVFLLEKINVATKLMSLIAVTGRIYKLVQLTGNKNS
jgi:hypothetical protein